MTQPNSPPSTPLLDKVNLPRDLKAIDDKDLPQLAGELRAEMIDAVSRTGGHLGAGLGVVELTIAIHKVFDTPHDRLIFDVGHQCYPHKILTGRRDRIRTLRQENGLSGFTRRAESEYDPFGAAHSSTSISAGLGMAVASELQGVKRNVISVIGDGAMSAGMAYEALNRGLPSGRMPPASCTFIHSAMSCTLEQMPPAPELLDQVSGATVRSSVKSYLACPTAA